MTSHLLLLVSMLLVCPAFDSGIGDDDTAVVAAGLDDVGGYYMGDAERIERGVHPSLQKVHVQGIPGGREVLRFIDRAALAEYARLQQKPAEEPEIGVAVLDSYLNTAVARIDSADFVDYAQVARINGEWRIVNVLWAPQG